MAINNPKPDPEMPDSSEEGAPNRERPRPAASWVRSTQLSGGRGVSADVGSIALDRVMLVGGAAQAPAEPQNIPRGTMADPALLELLSDAEVMLRVAAGDDGAFDYLVEKYRRPMVSFMYRMTHNQAVAEELAQEVFLRVYRSRANYAAEAKFTTWLYRIATNLAVNHARDTKAERSGTSLDEPDPETGLTLDVADP